MTRFKDYRATDGFYYQMTPFCVFCGRKTNRMIDYRYRGVELDEREFPIPVHPLCYRKKKMSIWLVAGVLFAAVLMGAVQLESRLFTALPFWLLALDGIMAVAVAGYWAARRFSVVEHEIARYKRSHTDYEDHYKSDYRRRAGFKNW
jgi:hypothetical protein